VTLDGVECRALAGRRRPHLEQMSDEDWDEIKAMIRKTNMKSKL
jgi:hypothetical protein